MDLGAKGEAISYFEKGVKLGDVLSCVKLGVIYENGVSGVEQNLPKAKFYYEKACELNTPDSKLGYCKLGVMYKVGRGVEQDLEKGFEYLKKAADSEYKQAYIELADMYRFGKGVDIDISKAIYYLEKCTDNSFAYFDLGEIYRGGIGGNVDIEKAIEYFEKSSAIGNANADFALDKIYIDGLVEKDIKKAIGYFEKASRLNHFKAYTELGYICARLGSGQV